MKNNIMLMRKLKKGLKCFYLASNQDNSTSRPGIQNFMLSMKFYFFMLRMKFYFFLHDGHAPGSSPFSKWLHGAILNNDKTLGTMFLYGAIGCLPWA